MKIDKRTQAVYNRYKFGSTECEKTTSMNILKKICLKLNCSIEQIEEAMKYKEMQEYEFKVQKKLKQIFVQIVSKISDRFEIKSNSVFSRTHVYIWVFLTEKEKKEIDKAYKFYQKIYKKELKEYIIKREKIFEDAFIHKHELFRASKSDVKKNTKSGGMSIEELQDLLNIMKGLDDKTFIPDNKTLKYGN